jgi:arsenate reductase
MGEALLRHIAPERFEALSAGTYPAGYVHPLATAAMQKLGVPMDGQRSKSWDEFEDTPVDVVITVCDAAARESCPVWSGRAVRAFWPLPDPSFHPGTNEERLNFAVMVAGRLRAKLEGLIQLDIGSSTDAELSAALERIADL